MRKRQTTKHRQQSLKQSDKDLLIDKCSSMIDQLQLELQRVNKINQQQRHLIEILKEGKEYYQNEYKLNTFQLQFVKLQQENQHLLMNIQVHQQSSQQLKLQLSKISKEKMDLEVALRERDQIISQKEEKYLKICLQKELLQKEWNKVVRAVKKKINALVIKNEINPEYSGRKIESKETQMQTHEKSRRNHDTAIPATFTLQGKTLQKRAQNMVKFIDNMLAVQELQNILIGQSSSKKVRTKHQQNSQRKILREVDSNRPQFPFNVEFY